VGAIWHQVALQASPERLGRLPRFGGAFLFDRPRSKEGPDLARDGAQRSGPPVPSEPARAERHPFNQGAIWWVPES